MVIKVRLSHSRKRAPLERARLKTLWRTGFSPRGALAPPYASEAEPRAGRSPPSKASSSPSLAARP